ncbi:MAG: two pore domain potassium channel family protein [Deltaproteobacteria bacterium]|nr:two pore domain potassium channel family protein [Deltaproteobacteria bacterium]MBW2400906.1 two pore domain potassium channel family protein [Deltaproteobacteria bacterium]MBW2667092.1 two pore domain potassium channel family protein [Deltaproteobacteria bacterium]
MRLIPTSASYTGLLGLLATALIVPRIAPVGAGLQFAIELAIVAAMVEAVRRLQARVELVIVVAVVAVLAQSAAVMKVISDMPVWVVLNHASSVVFLFLVLGCILVNVWRQQSVETDTIVGGVVVYLMLGVAFAGLYQLVEFLAPGSFVVSNPEAGNWGPWEPEVGVYPRLFFFSFVTLTTLGYGDLVPAGETAGALTSFEAVTGSLYLTILISRLVGLHIAGSREKAARG